MNFNNKGFKEFRSDVMEALKMVEDKHKVRIELGGISYGQYEFTVKMTGKKTDDANMERNMFESECGFYGFGPNDYNQELKFNGLVYRLVGFNRKAKKNSCRLYCVDDGREYFAQPEAVKWAIMYKGSI